MNNFNYLDSIYNKKAKLYKNVNIVKNVQICDLTLEADGEEMAGLKFKGLIIAEVKSLLTPISPTIPILILDPSIPS